MVKKGLGNNLIIVLLSILILISCQKDQQKELVEQFNSDLANSLGQATGDQLTTTCLASISAEDSWCDESPNTPECRNRMKIVRAALYGDGGCDEVSSNAQEFCNAVLNNNCQQLTSNAQDCTQINQIRNINDHQACKSLSYKNYLICVAFVSKDHNICLVESFSTKQRLTIQNCKGQDLSAAAKDFCKNHKS